MSQPRKGLLMAATLLMPLTVQYPSVSYADTASESKQQLAVIGTLMGRMFGCDFAASSQVIVPIVTKLANDAGISNDRALEIVTDSGKLAEKKQRGSDPWECDFVRQQYNKISGSP